MTRFFIYFFVISQILLFISCNSKNKKENDSGFAVKDDLGNEIVFNSVPGKVISLAPNITEMLYTLGVEEKLAGNTLYCNYPSQAKKVTKIGDLLSVDYEKILSLKPNLIFITVEGNVKENYNKLLQLGFKVFASNPRNYEGIKKTFDDLSKIFQKEKEAEFIIDSWNKGYENIIKLKAKYPEQTAMFLVGLNPIMLAGKNTFINEFLIITGLKNIADDSPLNYPVFSREEILKRNPDYILITGMSGNETDLLKENYPEWKNLDAIKQRKVLVVDPDLYMRPGPRFIIALEQLFTTIHPEENPGSQDH